MRATPTSSCSSAAGAGVQRVTVHNHFPDLATLLPACTAHWLSENPLPDLAPALGEADPAERVRGVLALLYAWYRRTAPMQRRVQGERATVPELDAWVAESGDPMLAALGAALAAGFDEAAAPALVALALDFWTWHRLAAQGLSDAEAAALMAGVVARSAAPPAVRSRA